MRATERMPLHTLVNARADEEYHDKDCDDFQDFDYRASYFRDLVEGAKRETPPPLAILPSYPPTSAFSAAPQSPP
jgi:hypothetical protein